MQQICGAPDDLRSQIPASIYWDQKQATENVENAGDMAGAVFHGAGVENR